MTNLILYPKDSKWGNLGWVTNSNYYPYTIHTRSDQLPILPLHSWQPTFVSLKSFNGTFWSSSPLLQKSEPLIQVQVQHVTATTQLQEQSSTNWALTAEKLGQSWYINQKSMERPKIIINDEKIQKYQVLMYPPRFCVYLLIFLALVQISYISPEWGCTKTFLYLSMNWYMGRHWEYNGMENLITKLKCRKFNDNRFGRIKKSQSFHDIQNLKGTHRTVFSISCLVWHMPW